MSWITDATAKQELKSSFGLRGVPVLETLREYILQQYSESQILKVSVFHMPTVDEHTFWVGESTASAVLILQCVWCGIFKQFRVQYFTDSDCCWGQKTPVCNNSTSLKVDGMWNISEGWSTGVTNTACWIISFPIWKLSFGWHKKSVQFKCEY